MDTDNPLNEAIGDSLHLFYPKGDGVMRVDVTKELDKEHWIMDIHVRIETEDGERQKLKEFGELFDKFQEEAYKLSTSKPWENQNDIS